MQSASPCAPTGVYGKIGALGVGCDASKILVELSDNPGRQPDRTSSLTNPDGLGQDGRSSPDFGDNHGRDHDPHSITAVVLGTRVLDVSTLDPLTARLGAAPSLVIGPRSHRPSILDVNRDGLRDLRLEFDPGAIGEPSNSVLALTISTTTGLAERGEGHVPGRLSVGKGDRDRPQRVSIEPAITPFAIRAARFDPTTRQARVDFAVPAAGMQVVELFDVSGRRLSRVQSIATNAGPQTATLTSDRPLASGIYLVRVAHGGEALSARIVVVR